MSAFFAMGGYADFVWPAYIATFIVLGLAIGLTVSAHARARGEVHRLEGDGEDG